MSLLEVENLTKSFSAGRDWLGRRTKWLNAVKGVSFTLERGECLAVVGESGAGKSTVGRMVLRLIEPDSGSVTFDGIDVLATKPKQLRALRQRMQMIFQDPYSSLDPRMTIRDAVAEPLLVHTDKDRATREKEAVELLDKVGIGSRYLERYPAELSGGQLQRVAIARALTMKPSLIVCDEPVAALDVSVRAQVLNLLRDLQEELGLAYLFVCHDLALVEVIADRVMVMAAGEVVETDTTDQIFANPRQEYTKKLLAAIPVPLPRDAQGNRLVAPGRVG
ncbi:MULTISPECIES: ABC transporter ATP-binding protein [Micromonospora]|uniref:ABC transporter ATP-binding protein n=1 Tax=Micromonospora chalcea TaxID=1874 RepID=A0ABX9Y260_MICCH|nr:MULTISPECIES: ATP-binding cassette domain-containing protein [Micromonospora]EWM64294.1 oligopeptide/dipeptide ABC transporter ATP-binding protein [Micromonospora sp. M42]MBQ1068335.1 ABC transporter ATP-binding protein [Micromonospora sp. D75]MCK1805229.1 ATP-binding cassette domain-containing protein [Micromonospora sp. R42106]MCK1830627.1 ATP-binding cassette domain-containing protein [Micromonospora sp. R42003]MCK1842103.1 ATP-binding cassette domain-containing protein [Micromonospora s